MIDAVELEGLEAWTGANKTNVFSMYSWRTHIGSEVRNIIDSETITPEVYKAYQDKSDILKWDCADLVLHMVLSYHRDNQVEFEMTVNWTGSSGEKLSRTYNSSDKHFKSYDQFFEELRLMVGPEHMIKIASELSLDAIKDGSLSLEDGDMMATYGHANMVFQGALSSDPTHFGMKNTVGAINASGSYYGKNSTNPLHLPSPMFFTGYNGPWATPYRFNFIKDAPLYNTRTEQINDGFSIRDGAEADWTVPDDQT